jgi:hypothetical protein
MTKRPKTKAELLTTTAPAPAPEKINWDDAVAEGKRLVAEGKRLVAEANQMTETADRYDWRLAELADQVAAQYGQDRLGKFATEIGIAHCTVKRRRTTYRNWKEAAKSDPGLLSSLSYSVARELENHPERVRLVKENPNMTKREAAALKKDLSKPESEEQRHWNDMIKRAGKALGDMDLLKWDRKILLGVVEPTLFNDLREGAKAWAHLADSLEKLFKEPTDEFDTAA